MKKITRIIALALVAGLFFASCESTDSLIQKYEKACKAGDTVEAGKFARKIAKRDLSQSESDALLNAQAACGQQKLDEAMGDAMKDMPDFE